MAERLQPTPAYLPLAIPSGGPCHAVCRLPFHAGGGKENTPHRRLAAAQPYCFMGRGLEPIMAAVTSPCLAHTCPPSPPPCQTQRPPFAHMYNEQLSLPVCLAALSRRDPQTHHPPTAPPSPLHLSMIACRTVLQASPTTQSPHVTPLSPHPSSRKSTEAIYLSPHSFPIFHPLLISPFPLWALVAHSPS